MTNRLIKVEGQPNLARDSRSGAIVNINKKSIEDARKAKDLRLSSIKRLDKIEDDVSEIKAMLEILVGKNV